MAAVEKPKRKLPRKPGGMHGTVLTKALGTKIAKTHGRGVSKAVAARSVGLSPATVEEWVRRGEGRDDRPATPLMTWFAQEMRKAEAAFIESLAVAIHTDPDWHAKAWTLERRFPEEYGRPADRLEVTGAGGGAIEIKVAFDTTPIAARTRAELGGPVIDVDGEELT